MSDRLKPTPSYLEKRVRRVIPRRESQKRPQFSHTTALEQPRLPPPPPPVESNNPFNFNDPQPTHHDGFGGWQKVKSEPRMHEPSVAIKPGTLGSAQKPIEIDIPPSLEDIKRETLPSTARSNYVRHSEMTEEEAKARRRQQNRASARRTRQKTRNHIVVLEGRYRDLRKKYTILLSMYQKVAGPNARVPTFMSEIALKDEDDMGSLDKGVRAIEQRLETSPSSKKRKRLRKENARLLETLTHQKSKIAELERDNRHLTTSLMDISMSMPVHPQPQQPPQHDLNGRPATPEDVKPDLVALGAVAPVMPTPPVGISASSSGLTVSPVQLGPNDPDIEMGNLNLPPQLEGGGHEDVNPNGNFDFLGGGVDAQLPYAGIDFSGMNFGFGNTYVDPAAAMAGFGADNYRFNGAFGGPGGFVTNPPPTMFSSVPPPYNRR